MPDPSTIGQTIKAWLATATYDYARARERRREGSVSMAEVQLLEAYWELGAEPLQQASLGPYNCDFYFPELKLVVEVDGKAHEKRLESDAARDAYFAERGYATLRIPAAAVFYDAGWCARITAAVGGRVKAGELAGAISWKHVRHRFPGLKTKRYDPDEPSGFPTDPPVEPDPTRAWDDAYFAALNARPERNDA